MVPTTAALADPLTEWIAGAPLLAPYARPLSLGIVVVGITYLSVVVGELVPKRLALLKPEVIAAFVSRPMHWLARAARPLVWLLVGAAVLLLGWFAWPVAFIAPWALWRGRRQWSTPGIALPLLGIAAATLWFLGHEAKTPATLPLMPPARGVTGSIRW